MNYIYIIEDLRTSVVKQSDGALCFPVDPTSRAEASVGGSIACNCSGFTPGEAEALRLLTAVETARNGDLSGLSGFENFGVILPVYSTGKPNRGSMPGRVVGSATHRRVPARQRQRSWLRRGADCACRQ